MNFYLQLMFLLLFVTIDREIIEEFRCPTADMAEFENENASQITIEPDTTVVAISNITDQRQHTLRKKSCIHRGNSVCCCAFLTIFSFSKNEVCNCIWLEDGNRTIGRNVTINGRRKNFKKMPIVQLKENPSNNYLCGRYNFLLMTIFCAGLDGENSDEVVTICPNVMSRTLVVLECKLYFGCFHLK